MNMNELIKLVSNDNLNSYLLTNSPNLKDLKDLENYLNIKLDENNKEDFQNIFNIISSKECLIEEDILLFIKYILLYDIKIPFHINIFSKTNIINDYEEIIKNFSFNYNLNFDKENENKIINNLKTNEIFDFVFYFSLLFPTLILDNFFVNNAKTKLDYQNNFFNILTDCFYEKLLKDDCLHNVKFLQIEKNMFTNNSFEDYLINNINNLEKIY